MQGSPGTYVSAAGHTVLVVWLITGWGFSAEPLPLTFPEVTMISGDEFERMVAASTPTPGTAEPDAPVVPTEDVTPDVAPVADTVPQPATPDPVTPPTPEAPPPAQPEPPTPPADVTEVAPELPTPPAAANDLPPTERPQERPSDRIAPEVVAPPPPDTEVAAVVTDSAAPDQQAPDVVEEPLEAAAPEATATQIVPEDAVPSGAVETSIRPAIRPAPPQPAPQTPAQTTTADSSAADEAAVAAAVAAAANATASPDVPQGPPMTGSEREGFRVAVNACWNVDPGSVAARVTVEVGFSLDRGGRVEGDVRLLSAQGGDNAATDIAFQAARRAILRCQGAGGYQLPADKYGQWQEVVITFDPSGMRLR